jgi:hypothetical protein
VGVGDDAFPVAGVGDLGDEGVEDPRGEVGIGADVVASIAA